MKTRLTILLAMISLIFTAALFASQVKITVSGSLPSDIRTNVVNTLKKMQSSTNLTNLSDRQTLTALASQAIRSATSPFGYFHPIIHAKINSKQKNFRIELGTPILVQSFQVIIHGPGKSNKHFIHIQKKFKLRAGTILNTRKYQTIKDKLYLAAATQGYFKAKMITSIIKINRFEHKANIKIVMDTGKRYKIGQTTFSNTPFATDFLKQFLRYQSGQYYSNKLIQATQNNLSSSSYFQQAIVTPEPNEIHGDRVPIKIFLIPVIKKTYVLGIGYGSDTGIRALMDLTNQYINRHGHRFETAIQLSKPNSNVTAAYYIPTGNPATDYYSISAGYTHLDQGSGKSNAKKIMLSYNKSIGRWQGTISANALSERYDLSTNKAKTNANLIYPSINLEYLTSDRLIKPSEGILINLMAAGTIEQLSSKTGFTQFHLAIKLLRTLHLTHTRFLLRGEIARTNIPNINNLPLSLQLFTGGPQSIRGYSYNSIGPGRNLILASAELQQRVYHDFYIAGFFDSGNVSNSEYFMHSIKSAAGTGIVWLSPIGMLEITAAKPLPKVNSHWVFQFSMGPYL